VFEYDTEALIEPFIKNRLEINVAVAGLDTPVASVTEMPLTSPDQPLSPRANDRPERCLAQRVLCQ
jgi:hypothetical protein